MASITNITEDLAHGTRDLRYPNDLCNPPFDKWITFEAREGRHVGRNQIVSESNPADRTLASVSLYLSESALKSKTGVAYDKNDLGPFAGAAVEFFAQTGQNLFGAKLGSDTKGLSASIVAGLSDLVSKSRALLSDGLGQTFLEAIKADVFRGVNELTGDTASAIFGQKPNPRTDILFDTVEYRCHDMEFMLIPRSLDEAKAIDGIIHFFQFYMLPSYNTTETLNNVKIGAFMIGFPYEFEISFNSLGGPMEHINKIGRSVLKEIAIDHAAGSKTAFIKENGEYYPVATKLGLSFQEVRLLSRDRDEIKRAGTADLEDPRSSVK